MKLSNTLQTNQPIRLAIPKNSELNKDCETIVKALQFEQGEERGILKSRLLPDLIARQLRVQDIVRMMRQGFMELGILCEDVVMEYGNDPELEKRNEIEKVFGLQAGDPVQVRLLIREEEKEAFDRLNEANFDTKGEAPLIIGSYPNVLRNAVENNDFLKGLQEKTRFGIYKVFGQTESMLRNGDVPGAIAAVDVVRSEKTAREYGLIPYGAPLIESQPFLAESKGGKVDPRIADLKTIIAEVLNASNLIRN